MYVAFIQRLSDQYLWFHSTLTLILALNSLQVRPQWEESGPLSSFHLGLFISEGSLPVAGSKTVQRGQFTCTYGIGCN